MALDFNLNLILPEDRSAIFSRASIEITCKLIKPKLPEIADELETLLTQKPLPMTDEDSDVPHKHNFYVNLDSRQVRSIVEVFRCPSHDQQGIILRMV